MAKILVVEDEQPILDNIVEILTVGKHDSVSAVNGIEGVEMAHRTMPDLILCDINMPGMDGYGVLMELRSDPRTTLIPFVFLTAYVDRPFQRRGMNLGAADYLTKPFSAKELLETVNAQLEQAQEREAARKAEMEDLRNNIVMSLPHELRTPLTGIVTCADMMLMDFADDATPDPARMEQLIRIVHKSGLRLQSLIENYLVYSQIELFSTDPERRPRLTEGEGIKHPMRVVEFAAHQTAAGAERADDVVISEGDTEQTVRVSEQNLTKIATEAVSNALKFSDPGQPIHVTGHTDGSGFTLTVKDSGRGMSPEHISAIGAYMQFRRKEYEQQGLGLGLVILRRLVELHDGRMTVHSEPDQGTELNVWFPLM